MLGDYQEGRSSISKVRMGEGGMKTGEEGFWDDVTGQVTEWGVVGTPSRLLSASFCGQPPETSGI